MIKSNEYKYIKTSKNNINKINSNTAAFQSDNGLRILGVAGSMRQASYSTQVLKMILEEAREFGAQTRLFDLRETNLPIYDPSRSSLAESNNTNNNYNLAYITNALKWADAFVLASPDYHGSMSGAIKNFLDYFWEEFTGKTFGYIVASHEKGLTVADQMRTAIRQCYGWSMPYNISVNGEHDFNYKRELVNASLAKRIKMLARDLTVYGNLIRTQFLEDITNDDTEDTFAARYRKMLQPLLVVKQEDPLKRVK